MKWNPEKYSGVSRSTGRGDGRENDRGQTRGDPALRIRTKPRGGSKVANLATTPVYDALLNDMKAGGLVMGDADKDGWVTIECPWHRTHSDDDKKSYYKPLGVAHKDEKSRGQRLWKCHHTSKCGEKDSSDFLKWMGAASGKRLPPPVTQYRSWFHGTHLS